VFQGRWKRGKDGGLEALAWWRILVLALFFYNILVLSYILLYFYGVCRLAELKFKRSTFSPLVFLHLIMMVGATFPAALSPRPDFDKFWFALPIGIASLLLLVASQRCYRVMMGK
jgi:hypothetical protein